MATAVTGTDRRAPLTQPSQTLESSRDAGYDLSAAVGEPVDNSVEAGANQIRIDTVWAEGEKGINEIAIADNGSGIEPDVLANVLSLGYSTRYGSREGMGRFGVGLNLGSLSQCRRIEIYSRPIGHDQVYCTYLDLDEVRDGKQDYLTIEEVEQFPHEFAYLMQDYRSNEPYATGTLVVWRKIDRLEHGGRYGTAVDEKLQELTKFLARAYRRFIDNGLYIELEGKPISLHDPTFQLENPRVIKKFGEDLRARVIDHDIIDLGGHQVEWTVTLLPEKFRRKKAAGGRAERAGEEFRDLYIPDNEGKLSILRERREIYYDLVPKLYPGGKEKVDRYIGVEVSFPAALDEYFQVRNVKRGAEPVSKLREELRRALKKPVAAARKEIRNYWQEVDQEEARNSGDKHEAASDAVSQAEETTPKGKAGLGVSQEEVDRQLDELIEDLGLDPESEEDRARAESIKENYRERAITIVDGGWPGKELIEIVHLSGKAIVKVNHRHPFISEVYDPIKAVAEQDFDDLTIEDLRELISKVDVGLDLLFMAYAKAENMHTDPETVYGELRSFWGIFAAAYVKEAMAEV